jgi:hypothetical protein
MEKSIQNHTKAVLAYTDGQGWTADTVSLICLLRNGDFTVSTDRYPHSFLQARIDNPNIADSIDLIMPDGIHMFVLSVVTKIDDMENATRTVLHLVFDEKGWKKFPLANGEENSPTAKGILDQINANKTEVKPFKFGMHIWIPDSDSNLELEQTRWPNTKVITDFNTRFGTPQ